MVTMKEIAAKCGCSVATVSKALNGMPDISATMAQHVREIATELGYTPNAAARALKTNRSRIIGLLLFLRGESAWEHEYFARMAKGVQSVAEAAGYDLTPVTCNHPELHSNYLSHCMHRGYDGIIVMSGGFDEPDMMELLNGPLPLVTIDYVVQHRGSVISDNIAGMRDLVQHIYDQGHRRIAYIHGEDTPVTRARLSSFYVTCEQLGLNVPDEYVLSGVYRDETSTVAPTQKLLDLPHPPTCILYPDDRSYVGGMNAILDRGLRIPEDISVAGYDGNFFSQLLRPRLTTLCQDAETLGINACELLLKAMQKPKTFIPEHITVRGRVLPGDSVARIEP